MADLTKGRVLVTNWHVFEPQAVQIGGVSAKAQAARRWVAAVNADEQYGHWRYTVATRPEEVTQRLEETIARVWGEDNEVA